MNAPDFEEMREQRAKVLLAVEEMEKTLSDELSQIASRKRELELQIELTQKRLTQQMSALRSQVRANSKAAVQAEEKYKKTQEKKKRQRKSGSSTDEKSTVDAPAQEYTRASLAQLFLERSAERAAQLQAHIAAREEYILSTLPIAAAADRPPIDDQQQMADHSQPTGPLTPDQAERLACLVQFRISEFIEDDAKENSGNEGSSENSNGDSGGGGRAVEEASHEDVVLGGQVELHVLSVVGGVEDEIHLPAVSDEDVNGAALNGENAEVVAVEDEDVLLRQGVESPQVGLSAGNDAGLDAADLHVPDGGDEHARVQRSADSRQVGGEVGAALVHLLLDVDALGGGANGEVGLGGQVGDGADEQVGLVEDGVGGAGGGVNVEQRNGHTVVDGDALDHGADEPVLGTVDDEAVLGNGEDGRRGAGDDDLAGLQDQAQRAVLSALGVVGVGVGGPDGAAAVLQVGDLVVAVAQPGVEDGFVFAQRDDLGQGGVQSLLQALRGAVVLVAVVHGLSVVVVGGGAGDGERDQQKHSDRLHGKMVQDDDE